MRLAYLLLLLLATACDFKSAAVNNMTYVKDSRTGYCFALTHIVDNRLFTHVPCEGIPEYLLTIPAIEK